MTSDLDGQLAFDIEGMIHEAAVEAAPAWTGAPLHFTTDYYSPADLDAAFEHWQFLHKLDDSHILSRMWHRAIAVPGGFELGDRTFELFTVNLRCEPWKHPEPHDDCCCGGDLTHQAICEPCGWHGIAADENSAVEGWHDHGLPGWRELPIVPARLRDIDKIGLSKAAGKWIEEHYPQAMQVTGAPVITERGMEPDKSRAAHFGAVATSRTPLSIRSGRSSRASVGVRRTCRWSQHESSNTGRTLASATDDRSEAST